MSGDMEIEYGFCVAQPLTGDDQVASGILPAGRYVSLSYRGNGLQGHKALIQYINENHLPEDSWEAPKGKGFRCRYEMYLTNPKLEPRKTS